MSIFCHKMTHFKHFSNIFAFCFCLNIHSKFQLFSNVVCPYQIRQDFLKIFGYAPFGFVRQFNGVHQRSFSITTRAINIFVSIIGRSLECRSFRSFVPLLKLLNRQKCFRIVNIWFKVKLEFKIFEIHNCKKLYKCVLIKLNFFVMSFKMVY